MTKLNTTAVPQAKNAMDQLKYEVANEIGVPLKQGYNGDLTSAQAGYVGGYMVNTISPKQHKQKTFTRREGMRNVPTVKVGYTYVLSLG
ncbi:MAG: alpha/beta-type small acid-soluble spore protein [Defluviitaleaceae bacterium]|nr:alpha/beta-type small acid-soluble spore protein [Defluviitaleaceae bacterium]MCL2239444.1 alpha/beta-type small acid-soluble spore protein [Defluviitaleaceae bacterium]